MCLHVSFRDYFKVQVVQNQPVQIGWCTVLECIVTQKAAGVAVAAWWDRFPWSCGERSLISGAETSSQGGRAAGETGRQQEAVWSFGGWVPHGADHWGRSLLWGLLKDGQPPCRCSYNFSCYSLYSLADKRLLCPGKSEMIELELTPISIDWCWKLRLN